MTSPMPPSPLTSLGQGAATVHEMFTAYMEAGFTRREAIQLVQTFIMTTVSMSMVLGQKEQS